MATFSLRQHILPLSKFEEFLRGILHGWRHFSHLLMSLDFRWHRVATCSPRLREDYLALLNLFDEIPYLLVAQAKKLRDLHCVLEARIKKLTAEAEAQFAAIYDRHRLSHIPLPNAPPTLATLSREHDTLDRLLRRVCLDIEALRHRLGTLYSEPRRLAHRLQQLRLERSVQGRRAIHKGCPACSPASGHSTTSIRSTLPSFAPLSVSPSSRSSFTSDSALPGCVGFGFEQGSPAHFEDPREDLSYMREDDGVNFESTESKTTELVLFSNPHNETATTACSDASFCNRASDRIAGNSSGSACNYSKMKVQTCADPPIHAPIATSLTTVKGSIVSKNISKNTKLHQTGFIGQSSVSQQSRFSLSDCCKYSAHGGLGEGRGGSKRGPRRSREKVPRRRIQGDSVKPAGDLWVQGRTVGCATKTLSECPPRQYQKRHGQTQESHRRKGYPMTLPTCDAAKPVLIATSSPHHLEQLAPNLTTRMTEAQYGAVEGQYLRGPQQHLHLPVLPYEQLSDQGHREINPSERTDLPSDGDISAPKAPSSTDTSQNGDPPSDGVSADHLDSTWQSISNYFRAVANLPPRPYRLTRKPTRCKAILDTSDSTKAVVATVTSTAPTVHTAPTSVEPITKPDYFRNIYNLKFLSSLPGPIETEPPLRCMIVTNLKFSKSEPVAKKKVRGSGKENGKKNAETVEAKDDNRVANGKSRDKQEKEEKEKDRTVGAQSAFEALLEQMQGPAGELTAAAGRLLGPLLKLLCLLLLMVLRGVCYALIAVLDFILAEFKRNV